MGRSLAGGTARPKRQEGGGGEGSGGQGEGSGEGEGADEGGGVVDWTELREAFSREASKPASVR